MHRAAPAATPEVVLRPAQPQRQAHIDHIRVLLTVMVVMVHAAITYGAPGGWYYYEVPTAALPLWLQVLYVEFNAVNQAYFMGLFFLVAGYYTPPSLERKGPRRFMVERLLRLGLPLAGYVLLLHPLCAAIAEYGKGGAFWGTLRYMYVHLMYGPGPLWFCQALLMFAVLYVAWRRFVPQRPPRAEAPLPSHGMLLLAALGTGLFAFGLRQFFRVGDNYAGMQLGYFASYIVLFFSGCRAARHRWLDRVQTRHALPWVVASLVLVPLIGPLFVVASNGPGLDAVLGGPNLHALAYAIWEPFVAWGIILGLLWLGRRFASGTTPLMAGLARAAYAVFCIHAPVLIALAIATRGWEAHSLLKWLVIGLGSTAISFGLGSVIVRMPGLKRIF